MDRLSSDECIDKIYSPLVEKELEKLTKLVRFDGKLKDRFNEMSSTGEPVFSKVKIGGGYTPMVDKEQINVVPGSEDRYSKKYDNGKCMPGQMFKDFHFALLGVAEITRYGIEKYQAPGSWVDVEDAIDRYSDALGRHLLQEHHECWDRESSYLHALHVAWNALAVAQLIIADGYSPNIDKKLEWYDIFEYSQDE